ncbi:hypothetical protein H4F20_04230 [Vibrio sp. 16]
MDVNDHYPLDPTRHDKLKANLTSTTLSHTIGSSMKEVKQLSITGTNIEWLLLDTASWLSISERMGTGDTTVELSIIDYKLTPGSYSTTITLRDKTEGTDSQIQVSAEFALPELTLSSNSVTLDISDGFELISSSLDVSLSTGDRIHPVTVSLPKGLHSSNIYASSTAKTLDVNLTSIESVKEGLNTFTATASAQVGEHTINKQFDVNVLASRRALVVPDRGVALTKFATKQRLTAEIDILDTYGFTNTLWKASTEAPWLTVTTSGTTADKLQLTADASGLATNQLHEAEVVVVPDDTSIANSNSIRVSLWVGDTDPVEKQVIPQKAINVAADPVRPYIYLNDGTADSAEISVYHSHTQEYVAGLSPGGTHQFGDIKVSEDGRWLYSGLDGNSIAVFDLTTFNLHTIWSGNDGLAETFTITEPSGVPLIVGARGNIYHANTGTRLNVRGDAHWVSAVAWYQGYDIVASSQFGNRFCAAESGLSPYLLHCYELTYNSYRDDVKVEHIATAPHGTDSFASGLAINNDGSVVYPVGSSLLSLDVDSMQVTQVFTTDGYAAGSAMGENNEVHATTSNYYGDKDIWIFKSDGSQRYSGDASGSNNSIYNELDVSGDGYQTYVIDDTQLIIMNSY